MWVAFKWVNSSLDRLALSSFWEDKERCTPEHAQAIRECGKVFLRRMQSASLTEVVTNTEHLTLLLREEAIEKWAKLEDLEAELAKLSAATQAQALASMHV